MSRNRVGNLKYLNLLASLVKTDSKDTASKIVSQYRNGSIKNVKTAERELEKLGKNNKRSREGVKKRMTEKEAKAVNRIKAKYENFKFRQNRVIESVESKDEEKPQTTTTMNLRLSPAFPNLPDPPDATVVDFDGHIDESKIHRDVMFNLVRPRLSGVIEALLNRKVEKKEKLKASLTVKVKLFKVYRPDDKGRQKYEQVTHFIPTKTSEVTKATIKSKAEFFLDKLEDELEDIPTRGTQWRIKQYLSISINTYKIKPERGSSYIPTPAKYSNAKCGLINIKKRRRGMFQVVL